MDKIRRMAKMYGCISASDPWTYMVYVYADGVAEEFYFSDEEKAGWFITKASKFAQEVQGYTRYHYTLLPW